VHLRRYVLAEIWRHYPIFFLPLHVNCYCAFHIDAYYIFYCVYTLSTAFLRIGCKVVPFIYIYYSIFVYLSNNQTCQFLRVTHCIYNIYEIFIINFGMWTTLTLKRGYRGWWQNFSIMNPIGCRAIAQVRCTNITHKFDFLFSCQSKSTTTAAG
jgi:hypothetical protein